MPEQVTMIPVASSMIESAGLDAESHLLVKFTTGKLYRSAEPVPAAVLDGLVSASSVGKYYNATVRGKFGMREVA